MVLLQNKCLAPKIVHRADVKNLTNDEKQFYFGVTEIPFKEGFVSHMWDFKHPKYRNSFELSSMYGNSKMLLYHQLLNGELLQKCCQKHN